MLAAGRNVTVGHVHHQQQQEDVLWLSLLLPAAAILSGLAILLQTMHAICLGHAMRKRRVSRKFNLLVLNKCLADSAFCLCLLLGALWHSLASKRGHIPLLTDSQFPIWLADSLLLASLFSYESFMLLRIYGIRWPFRFRKKFQICHAIRLNLASWLLFAIFTAVPLMFRSLSCYVLLQKWVDALKCAILMLLHPVLVCTLAVNVVLVYRNWRFARAFHNSARRNSNAAMAKLKAVEDEKTNGCGAALRVEDNKRQLAKWSTSPRLSPTSNGLDRTPSIVNRRHKYSLAKTCLNLVALSALHLPFLLWLAQRLLFPPLKTTALMNWPHPHFWPILPAFAGILVRIGADALLGTFCDIEVRKSFVELASQFLPHHFSQQFPANSGVAGSSLSVAVAGGGDSVHQRSFLSVTNANGNALAATAERKSSPTAI